jgi:pimeloyl-ACP methyl ester carboxylesterase
VLAYDDVGHGTHPLVLLHGFLGSGRNLGTLARRLASADELLRVVLPDQLGHGASPPLPEGTDLFAMADALLDLLTALGIDKTPIVGHSLGGRVALAAKSRAPERIERIVLLDITPGPTRHLPATDVVQHLEALPDSGPDREAFAAPLLDAGLDSKMVNWLLMNLARRDDDTFEWRIDRAALGAAHRRSGSTDLWPVIEDGADVVVIRGGLSPYVTDEDVERFAANGVDVHTIEKAGHFVHAERAKETFELVERALR